MHILVAIRKKKEYWIWEIQMMKRQIWKQKLCGPGGSKVQNNSITDQSE